MEKIKLVPKLRFPEFYGIWEENKLSQLLTRYSEINKDEEFSLNDILSLSSQFGIVNRQELLDDTYGKVNHLNYKKTRLNDFVYGKSISASYPYGLFKVNNHKDGLLSTLYFTFKVKEKAYPLFLDYYFNHTNRANNFLKQYVLVGDRYITADADFLLSGQIFIPNDINEQKKIASFLTAVDNKLQALKKKKELLEKFKTGVMQSIFSEKIKFKKVNGDKFSNWNELTIGDLFTERSEKGYDNLELLSVSLNTGVERKSETQKSDISSSDKSNYKRVLRDDIVYNSMRMWQGACGISKYDGIVSPAYTVITPKKEVNSNFFSHFFKTKKMINIFERNSQGLTSDTWNLKFPQLSTIRVFVPSFEEQCVIADYLTQLDSKIKLVKMQLEFSEQWKKALLKDLFV